MNKNTQAKKYIDQLMQGVQQDAKSRSAAIDQLGAAALGMAKAQAKNQIKENLAKGRAFSAAILWAALLAAITLDQAFELPLWYGLTIGVVWLVTYTSTFFELAIWVNLQRFNSLIGTVAFLTVLTMHLFGLAGLGSVIVIGLLVIFVLNFYAPNVDKILDRLAGGNDDSTK